MKQEIRTELAPGAIGPYSQGIKAGPFYYFSGQLPIDPKTNIMKEGITEQTHQVFKNIKGLLESQGLDFSNVVKTTVFLDNMDDFASMNEVYAMYFTKPYPARSAIEVARVPKGALLEVEVIAYEG